MTAVEFAIDERPPGRSFDRVFQALALLAACMVLLVMAGILFSTVHEAWPWFQARGVKSVVGTQWVPVTNNEGKVVQPGLEAGALLWGTLYTSLIALVLAVPVSVGIALFVTEIAPVRLRRPIVFVVDLLAVVPSVVFGLFGVAVLVTPLGNEVYANISSAVANIPVLNSLFSGSSGRSYLTAALVLAVMVVPIITSVTREVFATTPASLKEAAYALGATRWEMIRGAVFPHSRRGFIAGVMIGLGRAMGETIAVVLLVGGSANLTIDLFASGETMAAAIARSFNESTGLQRSALIGLGVVLFVITFLVNLAARWIAGRSERRLAGAQ
ncbi:MAG: phosphate ABC transporter permease subunit PstC [Acidimicrobiia bacterium]